MLRFRHLGVAGIAVLSILAVTEKATALAAPAASESGALQFTSGGHVLGFTAKDVLVATGSHALRVEFVGARAVVPKADGATAGSAGKAAALGRVTYTEIWDGITLAYDAPRGGVLRSTYTLAPGADPSQIRLRYNAPPVVGPGGGLTTAFAAGTIRESAPIAWQDVAGKRIGVAVAFRTGAEREVGFTLGAYDKTRPLTIDPTLIWHTFLGGSGRDEGHGIALDASGNVYVTGQSDATWGAPIRPYAGGFNFDAFVAKLDPAGNLTWNTFLGGTDFDHGFGIALDASGNVYVTGESGATWGTPIRPFGGYDAFIAKLDPAGNLEWNSFLGGEGGDVALDASGNVYVTGTSWATWGTPIRPFTGGLYYSDVFVAKFDPAGNLMWNTFLGGTGGDFEGGVVLDAGGNVYVTGSSGATWGTPISPFGDLGYAFVAKLDPAGNLEWNTFLGGGGHGIALDASGNVYVTGRSSATWGTPIRPFAGDFDAFVAKVDPAGNLEWNTFLGGPDEDWGSGIALDANGNVYVTGSTDWAWDTPIGQFASRRDALVAKLNPAGELAWSTSIGGPGGENGWDIALDAGGNVYVTGSADQHWSGTAVRPWSSYSPDAFVAALPADVVAPEIAITSGPFDLTESTLAQFAFGTTDPEATLQCSLDKNFFAACESPKGYAGISDASYYLDFDGVDDAAILPDNLISSATTETVEAWFKTTAGGVILGYQNADYPLMPTRGSSLYVGTDGRLYAELWANAYLFSEAIVNDGLWHHAALVRETPWYRLYLDGELLDVGWTFDEDLSFNQIGVGYVYNYYPFQPGWWYPFSGSIDEVRIWHVARTQAEIQANMSVSLTGSEAGLAGYWKFDEGLGTTAGDASLNGNTATLINGPAWSDRHVFGARSVDPSLNASSAAYTWSTSPDTSIGTPPANPTNARSASFTLGSTKRVVSYECKLDNGAFEACASPRAYESLVEGEHTFSVRATDAMGVTDPTPASYTWRVDLPPTLGGVTPVALTSAPGIAQSFRAVYSDVGGYANLKQVYLLINSTAVVANGMWLMHDRTVNKLYLANDAGTAYVGNCSPGGAKSLSNSQGTLNCAATTVTGSGENLTVNWSITPSVAFATGTKRNLYLRVRDMAGLESGYVDKGDWTIKSTNEPPTLGTLTPSVLTSAPGAARSFSAVYSDADGFGNIRQAYLLINSTAVVANGMWLMHDRTVNKLYLTNDAGTGYVGSCTPGVAGSLLNAQGTLDCAATTVTGSGNNLTVNWNITPSTAFASATKRNLYLRVRDMAGLESGYADKGDWTISPPPGGVAVLDSEGDGVPERRR